VMGCTPTQCARIVRDGFIDADHVTLLRRAADRGMQKLFHQGGSAYSTPNTCTDFVY
jgi:hypothetical protein